jgi:outer membrane protein assembly factor BamD (BamD/ComL family)
VSAAAPRDRKGAAASASSNLADQNDAFAEALALKHSGQDEAAVGAFERFASRYPTSNLAESAAVERMKILLVDDHAKGVAAAAQYLRRYPSGFARADATAAVAGSR